LLAKGKNGDWREFFYDRITFPIRDASGSVIGFSARKYKETTLGGKYINTPETPLFKKSHVLFGLNYCRRRIAKERRAIIVEGQIDALRLIQEGFNITVAGQGTAFGEGHLKELMNLGINTVYLAFDGDNAGQEAILKVGNLFQKSGVEVLIPSLPEGSDPDSLLREYGPEGFYNLLEKSIDYLSFLIRYYSRQLNLDSPAAKAELVHTIAARIREWEDPLMVHESLRKLSKLTHVPEETIGVGIEHIPQIYIKRSASVGELNVDPDRILEMDLLRWLLLMGESFPHFIEIAKINLQPIHFRVSICRLIYQTYLDAATQQNSLDLLSVAIDLDDAEAQMLMSDILQKMVNKEKAEEHFLETIQKLLDRHWMFEREEIRMKIHSGRYSDEEVLQLAKQFDDLKKHPPKAQR
jgi:DNA primase